MENTMEEHISNLLEKEEIEALLCPEKCTEPTSILPILQFFFSTHGLSVSPSQAYSNHAYLANNGQVVLSFSDNLCQILIDKTLGGKTTVSSQPFRLGTIGEKIISNFATEIMHAIAGNECQELNIAVEQEGILSISNAEKRQTDNLVSASIDNLSISIDDIIAGNIIPLNIPTKTNITISSQNTSIASGVMGRQNDTIAIQITSVKKKGL